MRETEKHRCAERTIEMQKKRNTKNTLLHVDYYMIYIFGKRAAVLVFFRLKKKKSNKENAEDINRKTMEEETCVNRTCLHANAR